MLSLKQALAFKWNNITYNTLLHHNSFPTNTHNDLKKHIKAKSKFFSFVNNNIQTSLVSHFHHQPITFTVIQPHLKDSLIKSFLQHEFSQALNYKQLYTKIIHAGWLGISRQYVYDYLKKNPLPLQEVRVANQKPYVQSFRPMYPFEYWQIDLIDFRKLREQNRFPSDNSRMYKWILVIIDIFSKFIYLYPIEGNVESLDQTMMQEICNILQKLFLSGDIPKKIGSDNQFNTQAYNTLCTKFHIKAIFGLPHHPQTQGFVENKIKHIKSFIYLHFNTYKTLCIT